MCFDGIDNLLMASAARTFGDPPILRGDTEWLYEITGGKRHGVAEAVRRLIRIFCHHA